ncbi:hypothetical protein D3C76_1059110 [compost metagenome]
MAVARRPFPELERTGRPPDSLSVRPRFQPHRADADHGASVRGFLGLPAAVDVRAHGALRQPGGLRPLRRPLPRCRAGGHPRLGAGAFPYRRARARALRWHVAVRICASVRRLPPGLGHLHLQPRPQRSARLHAGLGAALAARIPYRWSSRGCRGVDALSRLLAQGRRVDSQPAWRTGESRSHRIPLPSQCRGRQRGTGRPGHRRGIHRLAGRQPADGGGRAGLFLQMEHGLDARQPGLYPRRPPASRLSPPPPDVRPALRLLRAFHPAHLP